MKLDSIDILFNDIKFEKYDDRLIRLFIDKVGVDVWQRIKQEYMLELFLYLRVL